MLTPSKTCSRCKKALGAKVIRTGKQQQYHPACFTCDACKKPLDNLFTTKAGRLYHGECHDKLFVPRCHHCGESIKGTYSRDEAGRYHPDCYTQLHQLFCSICEQAIRGSYAIDHWGNKAHAEHDGVATGLCHVCARLMPADASAGGRPLDDGRLLCAGCHQSEIVDFKQIQQAKLDVIAQMLAVGFEYIPDYIKVELSQDQQLLNERMRASPTGNIHGFTRTSKRQIPGYGEILEHSISVLSGLPRVAFMGVLAHELLHVWIHEQGLSHLSHAQVEGFCNLGTALMLENALTGNEAELARVLLERMQEDTDPAYGDGYRAMNWRLQSLGWPGLIAALQNRDQPLAEPEPELIRPKPVQKPVGIQPTASPAAPSAASKAATERLQDLRQKLQQAIGTDPKKPAPSSTEQTELKGTDSKVADKVREKFARPQAGGSKPASQGSKLGKLKRPGRDK